MADQGNYAHIKGKLKSIEKSESKGGNKYLSVSVDCRSPKHGTVVAYCNVFNLKAVEQFLETFEKGMEVYLKGSLNQYMGPKSNKLGTSFNVFAGEEWSKEDDQHNYYRATFVVIGELTEVKDDDGEKTLKVKVTTEGKDDTVYSNNLELNLPSETEMSFGTDLTAGSVYKFVGALQRDEDSYGETIRRLRPVVKRIEVTKDGESDNTTPDSLPPSAEPTQGGLDDIPF